MPYGGLTSMTAGSYSLGVIDFSYYGGGGCPSPRSYNYQKMWGPMLDNSIPEALFLVKTSEASVAGRMGREIGIPCSPPPASYSGSTHPPINMCGPHTHTLIGTCIYGDNFLPAPIARQPGIPLAGSTPCTWVRSMGRSWRPSIFP